MTSKRFVFDTNVLVSAAIRRYSLPRQALDHVLLRGHLLMLEVTIHELREVLFRPKFDKYVSMQTRLLFLTTLLNEVEAVTITQQIVVCRDPRDDKFLDLAINGGANCIISGDEDLLSLHPFRTIPIFTPRAFLEQQW
ncbi:MAG TPA: putative toxin-antitoxin system toxin component, PIN family [Herpetosiphonaceae bacterium]